MGGLNLSDVDGVRDCLLSFDIFEGARKEGINYVTEALRRFLITVNMVPSTGVPGQKLLELGASPYFLTTMLLDQTQYHIELANFFGDSFPDEGVKCTPEIGHFFGGS